MPTQSFFCDLVAMVEDALTVSLETFVFLLLHLLFDQTSIDEQVETQHHYFLLPIYQQKQDPYTFLNLNKPFLFLSFRVANMFLAQEMFE